ncbi:DegV family EDD domain-containing protein, partial [Coprobacillus cateniformis]|nr:DegV family EDD domain-containing protein [Coprobacillus cateniformis]
MKVAILTDSNSGITQDEANKLGVFVLPMPFTIDGQEYKEDINLSQEEFYDKLMNNAEVFTSQPAVGEVTQLFDNILKDYDQIVHIPMSSGLSGSCQTALMLAEEDEYKGKVYVVDSQRISVTQKYDVLDALELSK